MICSLTLFIGCLAAFSLAWWRFGRQLQQKWFAEYFKDRPVFHNEKTLPYKKKLFESLHSSDSPSKPLRILEIGAGSGANFQFYPLNTLLTVVDPNPYFNVHLTSTLQKYPGIALEKCVVAGAESMPQISSQSFDAVVSTLVLCSCPDVPSIFSEVSRVLVPGGRFYFMEHVIDPRPCSFLKFIQLIGSWTGFFQFFFGGCRADKNLEDLLRSHPGFEGISTSRFSLKGPIPWKHSAFYFITPHMFGSATTPK